MKLDFSEIPSAKAPSQDIEAFEKFCRQFYEHVLEGKIEKTAGRGADGGVDLIVKLHNLRLLISCKHYLSSSVTASAEEDPKGRLDSHGCDVFVGLYSGSVHNSLISKLKGISENHRRFEYKILDGRDIETRFYHIKTPKVGSLLPDGFH